MLRRQASRGVTVCGFPAAHFFYPQIEGTGRFCLDCRNRCSGYCQKSVEKPRMD